MKRVVTPALLFFLLILASCRKDHNDFSLTEGLTGCWINPRYNDSTIVYERAAEFNQGPGIIFKEDGNLVERKNAGFCGTPPVTYADYEGTYTVNDSVISISVGYWGGSTESAFRLIFVDQNSLTVQWIN